MEPITALRTRPLRVYDPLPHQLPRCDRCGVRDGIVKFLSLVLCGACWKSRSTLWDLTCNLVRVQATVCRGAI